MNEIIIKTVNVLEYIAPYESMLIANGTTLEEYASTLKAFVDPTQPDIINMSDKIIVDSAEYKRFISHETRHILDHRSGLIPYSTISGNDVDKVDRLKLLRAETRAMVAEAQHMSNREFEAYKMLQFANRRVYKFDDISEHTYFGMFDMAEEELLHKEVTVDYVYS